MSFTNKVVIITGGSAGIGASTAVHFAKEGANVVIVGRNEIKLQKVAEKCQEFKADNLIVKADISNEDDAKKVIEETITKYGKLDVLVNNAGILRSGSILDGELLKIYDEVMSTNLKAVVVLTCLAAPYLIGSKGNVVNISSVLSKRITNTKYVAYCTSKAGLDMFTRGTALELAPHGVRVNIVHPGPVRTEIFEAANMSFNVEVLKDTVALRRISDPEEIADLILYLASDKAKGLQGRNSLVTTVAFCLNIYLFLYFHYFN